MFFEPNLAPTLELPLKYTKKIIDINLYKISYTTFNLIREAFVGFETQEKQSNIFLYYFKRFKQRDKQMAKQFEVHLDWSEFATHHIVKILNMQQLAKEMTKYFHEFYKWQEFENISDIGKRIERILCEFLSKEFIVKSLGNYLMEITNIPVLGDEDDLNDVGMGNALEIDIDKIYVKTDIWENTDSNENVDFEIKY